MEDTKSNENVDDEWNEYFANFDSGRQNILEEVSEDCTRVDNEYRYLSAAKYSKYRVAKEDNHKTINGV